MRILFVMGTRPEAIKLAPVVQEVERRHAEGQSVEARLCVTGQHRDLMDQALGVFNLRAHHDLDVMTEAQTPALVASRVLERLDGVLRSDRPDWIVVEGDTTSVAAASLAAYYARIPLAHVEAGLRSHDKWQPFPEELNRRVAGVLADLHLAPTTGARTNLLREGVATDRIVVTGNPVVDALHWALGRPLDAHALAPVLSRSRGRLVVVTVHRRENHGAPLEDICAAIADLAARFGDSVLFAFTVHPNPNVHRVAGVRLAGSAQVALLPPLDYVAMAHLLQRCRFVVTDSGGLQEEAPGLGKPVLVLRDVTERPEGIAAGTAKLIGTSRARIVAETSRLLEDEAEYGRMARAVNPYGDGHASPRIVDALLESRRLTARA